MPEDVIAEVCELFHRRGDSQYGHEAVSQREHALQAALLAEQAGAAPERIVAALLHDIGHLLHTLPEDASERGVDDHHEELAARWLEGRFPPRVVAAVRMHVPAKRYLCAVESEYLRQLSGPSQVSLRLQGGPMTQSEVCAFEATPNFRGAVELRRWDDAAKVPGLVTPTIEHFVPVIRQVLSEFAS
jgi:phosphonate degradation associated HDIG domain protein